MATLGTAYVQIVPSARDISGSIEKVLGPEGEAAGTAVGGNIGTFAKRAIKAAAIGTAVVGTVKAAMSEGGKLQQSYIGGVDTLYGEAANSVREYAKEAVKAGISMNTYSEQAVSFGASLKSAFGGDVKKAAESANTAIMDMADNSAKMGTDITMIQNAYQGFAKQNYTMLDNLKLGYGGTKTEMQRLLKDAEALTGKKYDLNNLGDVYEAIHVIQGELGLTGVAAGEAEGTFTGSFASMKAAASNLLGELALGEDITESLKILLTSASTFLFNNMAPMIGNVLKGIPSLVISFISQGIPAILSGIGGLVSNIANYVKTFADGVTGDKIKEWVTTMLPKIWSSADSIMDKFITGIVKNLGKVIVAIGKIGLAIVKGLGSAIWSRVSAAATGIKDRFMKPITALKDKVKGIVDKIKGFFKFKINPPHIDLPHFHISPAGWKIGDLLKGSIPSLSIKWNAEGGIMKKPTLFGGGEDGAEGIIPLKPFWAKMDRITEAATNNSGNITINVYASQGMDVKALAKEVRREIINTEKGRRLAWQ